MCSSALELATAQHATTRTPGPSTAGWLTSERTKLAARQRRAHVRLKPLSRRARRAGRRLAATSGTSWLVVRRSLRVGAMKGAVNDVHLLLAGQPHKVHRVNRKRGCERGVFLRVSIASSRVARLRTFISCDTARAEETRHGAHEIRDLILRRAPRPSGTMVVVSECHPQRRDTEFSHGRRRAMMPCESRPCIGLAPGAKARLCGDHQVCGRCSSRKRRST